jgi:hypothetical protein
MPFTSLIMLRINGNRHGSVGKYPCSKVKKIQRYGYYGISVFEKWWPELESNQRHKDFQSSALPTELSGQKII